MIKDECHYTILYLHVYWNLILKYIFMVSYCTRVYKGENVKFEYYFHIIIKYNIDFKY